VSFGRSRQMAGWRISRAGAVGFGERGRRAERSDRWGATGCL